MNFLKALALATVPIVGAFLCIFILHLDAAVGTASGDVHQIAAQGTSALSSIDAAAAAAQAPIASADQLLQATTRRVQAFSDTQSRLDDGIELLTHRLTDLCPATPEAAQAHPCGTLADANRTLATVRGTFGQVEVAANDFDKHDAILYAQEADLASSAQKTVKGFNELLADPDIAATIHNGRTITDQGAAIITDGRIEADKIAHPTKKRGFIAGFEASGDVAKHWIPSLF